MWWMTDKEFQELKCQLRMAQHVADNSLVMLRLKTKWAMTGQYDKLIENVRKWH